MYNSQIDGERARKSQLVARGFGEKHNFRRDYPKCSRERLRVVSHIISSKQWSLNTLHVKATLPQGKPIEGTVFVKSQNKQTPPLYVNHRNVYSLADASRHQYLKFRDKLIKLGVGPTKLDQGIFMVGK